MKCSHCNFERAKPFKFCPLCGTATGFLENIEPEIPQITDNNDNLVEQPSPAPRIMPFVKKLPRGLTEETYKERKSVKKLSRLSGGAFLTLEVVSSVFVYGVYFSIILVELIMGLFGHSYKDYATKLFGDPYFLQLFQILASTIMFTIPFLLFFKLSKHKVSELIDFNLPKNKNWFPYILMGIGFCSFANIANSMAASLFSGFGVDYNVDFGEDPKGLTGFLLSFLATAIVPAFVEEFACRGLVMGALKKHGEGFAIMSSAILFGFIHGNFQQIPFAFMVGLILGFVAIKCGSIWPAIFIHFYNNCSSVVFTYLFMDMDVLTQNIIYTIYLAVCLFIGIISLFMLKSTDAFKLNNECGEATENQKYKWFFTTELVILVIIVCIANSLQYFVL